MSKIEWTEKTWNPTTGCDRVSPGCDQCYAMELAHRLKSMGQARYQLDGDPTTSGPGFALQTWSDKVREPERWTKPALIFVNSMSDVFHEGVSDEFIGSIWATMARTADRHTYQVLTKRPQRAQRLLNRWAGQTADTAWGGPSWRDEDQRWNEVKPHEWPLRNVALGTSIESDRYTFRARHLRETPAAGRFLSLEPLLGPLPSLSLKGIDWVIVGAESKGPWAGRPMDLGWVRDIRERCIDAGVPFFVKQIQIDGRKVTDIDRFPEDLQIREQMANV